MKPFWRANIKCNEVVYCTASNRYACGEPKITTEDDAIIQNHWLEYLCCVSKQSICCGRKINFPNKNAWWKLHVQLLSVEDSFCVLFVFVRVARHILLRVWQFPSFLYHSLLLCTINSYIYCSENIYIDLLRAFDGYAESFSLKIGRLVQSFFMYVGRGRWWAFESNFEKSSCRLFRSLHRHILTIKRICLGFFFSFSAIVLLLTIPRTFVSLFEQFFTYLTHSHEYIQLGKQSSTLYYPIDGVHLLPPMSLSFFLLYRWWKNEDFSGSVYKWN